MTQRRAVRRAMTDPDRYLTVPTTASLIGRSRQTVYAMVASGQLHGEHIAGRLVIVRASLPQAAKDKLALREKMAAASLPAHVPETPQ